VDALAGQPLVHVETGETPVVDLQEVGPGLRVGRFLRVKVDRSDLPDGCLQACVRLVHVLHRRLDRDAAAPELLEHERVFGPGVELPFVHHQREERAPRVVEEPRAEHAGGADLREHRRTIGPEFAETEGDDEHFAWRG